MNDYEKKTIERRKKYCNNKIDRIKTAMGDLAKSELLDLTQLNAPDSVLKVVIDKEINGLRIKDVAELLSDKYEKYKQLLEDPILFKEKVVGRVF